MAVTNSLKRSGEILIDFGFASSEGDSIASLTIAADWITANTKIICYPLSKETAHHAAEDVALENIGAYATNFIVGVSFDVIAVAPNNSFGTYYIQYQEI